MLHCVFELTPLRQSDLELVLSHGRRLRAGHRVGARQDCQKSSGIDFHFEDYTLKRLAPRSYFNNLNTSESK